jgi:acetoin utilization deacetylase AcuC-like enzyme
MITAPLAGVKAGTAVATIPLTMRVVYSPKHLLHEPIHEVEFGIPIPNWEVPARAEEIRRALLGDGGFTFEEPREYGLAPIEAVHDPGLVRYLEGAWRDWRTRYEAPEMFPDTIIHPALREGMEPFREPAQGIGRLGYWCFETMTPIVPGSYTATRAAVDTALTAAELVLGGEAAAYGLCRPPGHHSPRAAFGGYCFFNYAAVVANDLVRQTGEPVAVLDLDYHHGNGTQQIFYRRSDVLYASLHGDPDRAYPYFCGFADETGTGEGKGATINVPLPIGCTDEQYLEALQPALEAVAACRGSIVVISLGFDTYGQDPIADFALTTPAYHRIGSAVKSLGKRLVILQEGGYFLPQLGENARQFLRGVERRPLEEAGETTAMSEGVRPGA